MSQITWSDEHHAFRAAFAKFLDTEAVPYHAEWEKKGQVDRAIWTKAGQNGFLCYTLPEQYGGSGVDFRYTLIAVEEVSRRSLSGLGFGVHSDIVAPYILKHSISEEQKMRYLPKLASGEMVGAIAMTEPGAGSDLQSIRTTAILDGDHYVVNGSKTFITNGQHCDLLILVCKTDPTLGAKGVSLLLVEANTPGFVKGRNLDKIGMKAQYASVLFFQDMRVPKENLLGEAGKGFGYLMTELPQERLTIGAGAISSAEVALERTLEYTKERKVFGKSVADFQYNRFKLAEMATEITIGRSFLNHCIELHVNRQLDAVTAAKLKWWSTELQNRVIDQCLQMHGGFGYMWEFPIARQFADSRVSRIYGGSNEVMKEIIARTL